MGLQLRKAFGAAGFDHLLQVGGAVCQPVELALGDLMVLGVEGLDVDLLQRLERRPVAGRRL